MPARVSTRRWKNNPTGSSPCQREQEERRYGHRHGKCGYPPLRSNCNTTPSPRPLRHPTTPCALLFGHFFSNLYDNNNINDLFFSRMQIPLHFYYKQLTQPKNRDQGLLVSVSCLVMGSRDARDRIPMTTTEKHWFSCNDFPLSSRTCSHPSYPLPCPRMLTFQIPECSTKDRNNRFVQVFAAALRPSHPPPVLTATGSLFFLLFGSLFWLFFAIRRSFSRDPGGGGDFS